jgi:hypothetical protein
MSEKIEQQYPSEVSQVYAQLKQQDVEQFYTGYQWWKIRERIIALQAEIGTLRQQIDENAQYMQEVRPPAVALATLARLQANGVHDLELLDRMLERGEGWLDLIMQRLDYCEQLEFVPDNYTQWCEHALEGAYDWIDSMRGADALAPSAASSDIVDLISAEATEELLLRKLTSEEEEEEEEAQPLEITLRDATLLLLPPAPAMQLITEETLPAVEEFENIAEGSVPEETDVMASSAIAFVEEDNAEILLPEQVATAVQETEFQDGDFTPELEIELPTAANAEADLSLDIQEDVHPLDEASYAEDRPQELFQQEMEISLLVETTASDDVSLVTEEQHAEQQTVEPALALDAALPKMVDAVDGPSHVSEELEQATEFAHALDSPLVEEMEAEINPTTVPIEHDSEPLAAEPAPILEGPSSFEGGVEADSVQVPIDQVASQEDTSVGATQETPLPSGADSSAASDELHNEQEAEVALPVETNAEITSPVEETPEADHPADESISQEAAPEAVDTMGGSISQEAAPEAVHSAEESIPQQDTASAPAQNVKPRGFWRWLLALFRE